MNEKKDEKPKLTLQQKRKKQVVLLMQALMKHKKMKAEKNQSREKPWKKNRILSREILIFKNGVGV